MRISHWTSGTVARHAALAAACAAGFIATVDCKPGGGGGGGTPAPTTASSNVSFRMFASGAPKCTADLRFEWAPISVSGQGTTSAVTVPPSGFTHYDVPSSPGGNPESPSTCDFNVFPLTAFALGTWQLTLVDAVIGPMAQCTVTLRAGANWAAFRQGIAGCKETPPGSAGFEYP